jgi:RNA polymerase sigma-70 factor (ECF subfamily)
MSSRTASPGFDFKRDLVALIPFLRAFAHSLCHQHSKAEDLAQETLAKAWRAREDFQPGTNLKAWLFTILRNELYSRARRDWRQTPWDETAAQYIPAPANEQQWNLELCDTADALRKLPAEQREAVILIGAAGFSYHEAAEICGVPEGTVKSRVARGRQALLAMLAGDTALTRLPNSQRLGGAADILAQLAAILPTGSAPRALHV